MMPEQFAGMKHRNENMERERKRRSIEVDPERNRDGLAKARKALADAKVKSAQSSRV